MFYINADRSHYEQMKLLLPDFHPDIKITLAGCDDTFENAPCRVCIDLVWDEMEVLLDQIMDIEIAAFNTEGSDDPPEDDPYYQKYLKYGWLWDVLFYAEEHP